jgi:hypothetical protein
MRTNNPHRKLLVVSLLLAASLVALSADAHAAPTPPATLARIDALHAHRDDPQAFAEERRLVDAAVADGGGDYPVLWRAARVYIWMGDDPTMPTDQRSELGKKGWDLAERAIPLAPNDPAGHYWAAVGMGTYALGIGVMKALSQGIEGKFRERLGRAEQLAPGFERGGIGVAWGRFYERLPWPKRDRQKAAENLRRTLSLYNPASLRARVFLAETLLHDDQPMEAKHLLDEVAAATVGRYDPPEERRAKAMGAALMPDVVKSCNE